MKENDILSEATKSIEKLKDQIVDVIEVKQPTSLLYALQLTKIVSKLSPLLGNLFEFRIVDALNKNLHESSGQWIRQDPGFPDARFFSDDISANVGVEIKAWFPFATEITGRFRDSEDIFSGNFINVAIVAWLPEFVFWGKPVIIKTLIVSGSSVAKARDKHYHDPPHYIVIEPEDTTDRSANLQQTNTAGYVFQDQDTINKDLYRQALKDVEALDKDFKTYKTSRDYQNELKKLQGKYPYRLDTNYAKIDRIEHSEIEAFKTEVEDMIYKGRSVKEWKRIASYELDDERLINAIKELLV